MEDKSLQRQKPSAASQNAFKRTDLEDIICEIMGTKEVIPLITRQINKYILENDMTLKEIARCIVWYKEVLQKEVSPIYGISFVPNVREAAEKYFKKLELDQRRQLEESKKIVEYQENNIIFNIQSLKYKKRVPQQLDICDIDIDVEGDDGYDRK